MTKSYIKKVSFKLFLEGVQVRCRSSSSTDYVLPRLRPKFGERAFSHTGPSAWSRLYQKTFAGNLTSLTFENFLKLKNSLF